MDSGDSAAAPDGAGNVRCNDPGRRLASGLINRIPHLRTEGHLQLGCLYPTWDVDDDLSAPCCRHGAATACGEFRVMAPRNLAVTQVADITANTNSRFQPVAPLPVGWDPSRLGSDVTGAVGSPSCRSACGDRPRSPTSLRPWRCPFGSRNPVTNAAAYAGPAPANTIGRQP